MPCGKSIQELMRNACLIIILLTLQNVVTAQNDGTLRAEFNELMTVGTRQLQAGSYDSCFTSFARAIALAENAKRFGLVAEARNKMGVLQIYRGQYAEALTEIQAALSIYERTGLEAGIAECHNNLGSIHYAQKDYIRARANYSKSLLIREQGTDRRAFGISLNNMGDVSAKLGELDKALEYHHASLALWEELGSVSGKAITLSHIASCMEEQGNHNGALHVLKQAYDVIQKGKGSRITGIAISIRVGQLLNTLDKAGQAREWCKGAYDAAVKLDSRQEIQKSCLCLYEAYQQLNMPREALRFYQDYVAMRDSIFGQEMTKEVTRLEMSYAFDKKQLADSLRFVAETALQEERIQRQRIGLVSTGSMLLLMVALGFAIYHGKRKSDALLLNILPKATAMELKAKGAADARLFNEVTVLFTDFKGFTQMSETLSPKNLVSDLHECFSAFDRICEKHGIEKIKTIGDAYMAAGGLPTPNTTHAVDVVRAALEMRDFVDEGKARKIADGRPYFEIRIGIHTGPVVAGIVGIKKFQYDIWGDTVNTTSRMESSGEVGMVNISEATYEKVKDEFNCEHRGEVEAKGKGKLSMYFVHSC
jgi:adenylate cyclase